MTSHELAEMLKREAEHLLSIPSFALSDSPDLNLWYWSEKDKFLAAVKAFGSGKKEWDGDYFKFRPEHSTMLKLWVNRTAVCRKVQEEKWECEPLLTDKEIEQIGSADLHKKPKGE